ncbi:glycerol-3-phosphate dehydrogenase [Halorhodospira abdelmalekii]|uniref:NAD(P)H-dependent glycerol-3-phosphate dehydrogenase n=1 Tax=Halorhodospira abdelmalekii TaxID=421629 RepID=UPI0019035695|nr:glycerol-3-phosphate dehydrogenase [Halorhodospira abdelmalekii]
MSTIAVLGAGAWGTALAKVLGDNAHAVWLWSRDSEHVEAINRSGENRRHLPGCSLPATLRATADLEEAVGDSDWILLAVPSAAFREIVARLAPYAPPRLAWATKGLEAESGGFLHGVVDKLLSPPPAMAVLSGPTFAAEIGRGLPAAMTVASTCERFAADMVAAFHSERFRLYTNPDMIGVQLGGAVKNVLAVATGVSDGLGLGANARAALVTRGLAEISRLGDRLGADPRTLIGLAGMGDLLLTCTDDQSRNRRFGLALGRGATIAEALESVGSTVEGARTAGELYSLAATYEVEMPISAAVHRLLQGEIDPGLAVRELMERAPKPEL